MKHLFQFLSILVMVALAACTNEGNDIVVDEEEEEVPVEELTFELSSAESRAAADILAFNQEFFKAMVATQTTHPNVVCSPLSASVLLSMVANAADGDIRREITEALGCSDLTALNSLSQKYLLALPNVDEAVTFTAVNAVWYDQQYTITPDFAKVSEKFYDAPGFARNFGNKAAVVNEINGWCKEKTNGIIESMLSELPDEALSILANAIYFKGQWGIPFEKKETEKMTFHGTNGDTTIDMMHKNAYQHYLPTDDFVAVKMQIGQGKFEAFFILPNADVDEFVATADFEEIIAAQYEDEVLSYYLPKFKYTPNLMMLNSTLASLGIPSINDTANLSMFTTKLAAVQQIFQKTGVEFTEEGAEGASVIMNYYVSANGDSSTGRKAKEVKFDRPFVFLIRETTTGAMLFAGKISEL